MQRHVLLFVEIGSNYLSRCLRLCGFKETQKLISSCPKYVLSTLFLTSHHIFHFSGTHKQYQV